MLALLFAVLGKKDQGARLLGNLRVDVTKNKQLLGWSPKFSVKEGFQNSFKNFKN